MLQDIKNTANILEAICL